MKTKQGLFFGFAVFALAAIFILAGCSMPTGGGGLSGDAETPVLSVQPLDAKYGSSDITAWPLFVSANVTDGGTLTYQWFIGNTDDSADGGTSISAASMMLFTPPITATGTVYYYVVVTNNNNAMAGEKTRSAVSRAAKVEKVDVPVTHAATPTISASGQPQSTAYEAGETTVAPLSVTATIADAGSLSYQWYRNTEDSASGGTPIDGETQASYTPPTAAAGTTYYYVIVTNTNNSVDGTKVRTATSDAAAIVVSGGGGGGGGGGGLDSALVAKWYIYPTQVDDPDTDPVFEINASGRLTSDANANGEINVTTSGGTISATVTLDGETYGAGTASYTVTGNRLRLFNPMLNGVANNGLFLPFISAIEAAQIAGEILGADGRFHKIDPSNPFVGTWTGDGYTLKMTAATWEIEGLAKGVYARDGNAATLTQTFEWFSFGKGMWMPIMYGEKPTYAATILGTTMTTTIGADVTFTKEAGNAAAPTIGDQPQDATYGTGDTASPLTVTASADGGSLSYQWYRNTAPSASGGTPIGGATADNYTPPIMTDGTVYYYVVVTNTSNGAFVTSRAAKVEKITGTVTNAATPTISVHPQDATYGTDDTASPLTVTATITDGGTLSYQWYRNTANNTTEGSLISTTTDYTPPTATAGTLYYYVMVTNTNNSVTGMKFSVATSNTAAITVNSNAATPMISTQPQDTEYIAGAMAPPLSVTAGIMDGGTLSYQWFSNTTNSTIGGTSIPSATNKTYMPSTAAEGTGYYYVIVTNTNTSVSGTQTSATTSRVATVTVSIGGGSSNPFEGTWTGSGVTLTVTASGWEIGGFVKGTYILNGSNTATLTPTHLWVDVAPPAPPDWAVIPPGYADPTTATVSGDGNTMTGILNGDPFELTKNGGGGGGNNNAAAPTISFPPQDTEYMVGAMGPPLSVTAYATDGGTLSYQWYSSATPGAPGGTIPGATQLAYMPSTTTAGTFYYYVIVTNTNNSVSGTKTATVTSRVATITVSDGGGYGGTNTLFIDIPTSEFTPETTDAGLAGIISTTTLDEDIFLQQDKVTVAGADFANGDAKIVDGGGGGLCILSLPLDDMGIPWTGSGTYDIYIILSKGFGGTARYFRAGPVTFSGSASTATISFSSATEFFPPQ